MKHAKIIQYWDCASTEEAHSQYNQSREALYIEYQLKSRSKKPKGKVVANEWGCRLQQLVKEELKYKQQCDFSLPLARYLYFLSQPVIRQNIQLYFST